MAIPKKHAPRVKKFVEIVLGMVVKEELPRAFYRKGALDSNYQLAIYNHALLPLYNDDRIEFYADVNGKKTEAFIITGESLSTHILDTKLVDLVSAAIMKIKIKEVK